MKDLREKFDRVRPRDVMAIFQFLAAIPFACMMRARRKDLWLICEDCNEARDNGFWLFRYIRQERPCQDVAYAINKRSVDYAKVKDLGEVVQYGSFKHWVYYLAANKNISSQKGGKPNAAVCYVLEVSGILKNKRAFLQHGVIANDMPWCYYDNTKMRLFVCGAEREYEFIRDTYGYPEGYVQYLGLARFDGLHDATVKEKQVLVMPSWREWIATPTYKSKQLDDIDDFTNTDYFRQWNAFLRSEEIANVLEENELTLFFYPHRNMQRFVGKFQPKSSRIVIADWREYDVQMLLKESAYLVTDYSSIFMDFGYMKKPMLYFQFDVEKFRMGQYQQGYFEFDRDGFGPVCTTLDEVEREFAVAASRRFSNEDRYVKRETDFFPLWDDRNCERNYKAIKEI